MNKGLLITISILAILVVGSISMYASIEYTNQKTKSTPVNISNEPKVEIISQVIGKVEIISEEITKNHEFAKYLVNLTIENYENGDKEVSALDKKLGFKIQDLGIRYSFVIDANTWDIVAHFDPKFVGKNVFDVISPTETKEQIENTLDTDDEIWVHYEFINPETDKIEPKTSLFMMHDGYIFGSGFYN